MSRHRTPLIAIVDDDPDIRVATSSLVRSFGYGVVSFGSADALLEWGKLEVIDCMVVDVLMPSTTGTMLQAQLLSTGQAIPLIFMSGQADPTVRQMVMSRGAVAFLYKPFSAGQVQNAIALALQEAALDGGTPGDVL